MQEQKRQKNPMKELAVHLAHSMDDQRRMREEFLQPWKEEEIRQYGKQVSDEIVRKGYDVSTMLYYAEKYKTLTFLEYREWIYQ